MNAKDQGKGRGARLLPLVPPALEVRRTRHPEFVLQRGSFPEQTDIWSVDLARGCAHRCAFCSVRGERGYAGDHAIYLYEGLAERLAVELAARKEKPRVVLLGAATDPFQPIDEVQHETMKLVRVLSQHGVISSLNTRGSIQPKILDELARHRDRVRVTVALATLDTSIQRAIEPQATSSDERLHLITELKALRIPVEVNLEPLLPNVTDTREQLQSMLECLADREVGHVTAGYLVLRPGVRELAERELASYPWLELLLASYDGAPMQRDGGQLSQFLHKAKRQRGYALLMALAANLGISVRLSRQDNPDFIASRSDRGAARAPSLRQAFHDSIRPTIRRADENAA